MIDHRVERPQVWWALDNTDKLTLSLEHYIAIAKTSLSFEDTTRRCNTEGRREPMTQENLEELGLYRPLMVREIKTKPKPGFFKGVSA